jgi:uncharacterized membrane protein YvlD (DUF360 family)
VSWSLVVMAVGTAIFPNLLPVLGMPVWVLAYSLFILVVAGILTVYLVTGERSEHRTMHHHHHH